MMIPTGAIVFAAALALLGVVFATLSLRELSREPATVRAKNREGDSAPEMTREQ